MRIRSVFPSLLSPHTPSLFSIIWDELTLLQPTYQRLYVDDEQEGRLEDADGLPYTLDFLVLEYLDFLQACIRAPPVRKELEKQLQTQPAGSPGNWIFELMKLATSYAQIASEEEGMWQIDINVFLAEETSVTANYTARTACGDLIIKLAEWLSEPTIQALLAFTLTLKESQHNWKASEATLYLLNQILGDWQDSDRPVTMEVATEFLKPLNHALLATDTFLRARGYLSTAALFKASPSGMHEAAAPLMQKTLNAVVDDPEEIVQVSCIRALPHYLQSLPPSLTLPLQASIISVLSRWMNSHDLHDVLSEGDDLMMTILETLKGRLATGYSHLHIRRRSKLAIQYRKSWR